MGKKYLYLFQESKASMRDLLEGKGANLAEMTQIEFPVPPNEEELRLEKLKVEELIDEINFLLNQVKNACEIDPDTLSRIDNLKKLKYVLIKRNKKVRERLRYFRKLNMIKARIVIVKAKSFIKRMFDSLGEFSKKAIAIYGVCRIILDLVEQVNQLLHKRKSRNGSFLFI